jgi:hypothetical protein
MKHKHVSLRIYRQLTLRVLFIGAGATIGDQSPKFCIAISIWRSLKY